MHIFLVILYIVIVVGIMKDAAAVVGEYQMLALILSSLYFGVWVVSKLLIETSVIVEKFGGSIKGFWLYAPLQSVSAKPFCFVLFAYVSATAAVLAIVLLLKGNVVSAFGIVATSFIPLTPLAMCVDAHERFRKNS